MAQNPETRLVAHPAMLAVGARPDVMIWKQTVGTLRAYDDPAKIIKVGVPGMADSMAVVAVTITPDMVGRTIGVAVAAEFKTATGRQRPGQKLWQDAFTKRGGIYRLVRSAADMVGLINDVQRGHW